MLESSRWRMAVLATWGLSGKCIRKVVRKVDGEEWSLSHIYGTIRAQGVRIKDYRDGLTQEAAGVIRHCSRQRPPLPVGDIQAKVVARTSV